MLEGARLRVLVQHEHLRAFPDAVQDGLAVPRDQGPQVDDLDGDIVALELRRSRVGGVDHRAPDDHGHVLARAVGTRVAEWRSVAIVRGVAFYPAGQLPGPE